MDIAQEQEVKQSEQKLTREQRRFIERIEREAKEVHSTLANKFNDFFFTHDNPEGTEVLDKVAQLDTQWRLFCRRKQLNKEALPAMHDYCHALLNEYKEVKTEQSVGASAHGDNETK